MNLALAGLYALTIIASMVGETWAYYLIGSVVELVILAGIAVASFRWR